MRWVRLPSIRCWCRGRRRRVTGTSFGPMVVAVVCLLVAVSGNGRTIVIANTIRTLVVVVIVRVVDIRIPPRRHELHPLASLGRGKMPGGRV